MTIPREKGTVTEDLTYSIFHPLSEMKKLKEQINSLWSELDASSQMYIDNCLTDESGINVTLNDFEISLDSLPTNNKALAACTPELKHNFFQAEELHARNDPMTRARLSLNRQAMTKAAAAGDIDSLKHFESVGYDYELLAHLSVDHNLIDLAELLVNQDIIGFVDMEHDLYEALERVSEGQAPFPDEDNEIASTRTPLPGF